MSIVEQLKVRMHLDWLAGWLTATGLNQASGDQDAHFVIYHSRVKLRPVCLSEGMSGSSESQYSGTLMIRVLDFGRRVSIIRSMSCLLLHGEYNVFQ